MRLCLVRSSSDSLRSLLALTSSLLALASRRLRALMALFGLVPPWTWTFSRALRARFASVFLAFFSAMAFLAAFLRASLAAVPVVACQLRLARWR